MSKIQFTVVVAMLSALVGLNAVPILVPAKTEPTKAPPAPTYEFQVVAFDDEKLVDELNKIGAAGWDIVSARRAMGEGRTASYELIVRRAK